MFVLNLTMKYNFINVMKSVTLNTYNVLISQLMRNQSLTTI